MDTSSCTGSSSISFANETNWFSPGAFYGSDGAGGRTFAESGFTESA